MQIDFHHAVVYVTARLAGFAHEEADIVAYASQYVDDATTSGAVCFNNKAMYTRISSSHKSIDLGNLNDVENHLVWLPFHFLPGNGGLEAGRNPDGTFIQKIICRPDSFVARDMLDMAFADRGKPRALHRLGIAMHVYADTWSHQGFAGVLHEVNEVEHAVDTGKSRVFKKKDLSGWLRGVLDDTLPPLGHGRANIFPDMPFLAWQYDNGMGETLKRNNTELFCEAADSMCRQMQRYRGVPQTGIASGEMAKIEALLAGLKIESGEKRHEAWLEEIKAGHFSFGPAEISYAARGKASWKAAALGTSSDLPVHTYNESFLTSNWKLFHDALQQHRLSVLHDILPNYGICAA